MKPKNYVFEKKNTWIFIVNIIFVIFVLAERFFALEDMSSLWLYLAIALNVAVSVAIIVFGRLRKKRNAEFEKFAETTTSRLLDDFWFPIIVTDVRGYILWYNESASAFLREHEADGDIFKKSISAVTSNRLSAENFRSSEMPDGFEKSVQIDMDGQFFRVFLNSISNPTGEILNMFVFEDITEIAELKTEIDMRDPVAAYFVIDNLDEATQKIPEKYRIASGAVSDLLHKFAENHGGVLKEYDNDKYLCFFENRALKNFVRNKFRILDDVREIKIEELTMPVTISGGVSNIFGTLSEKEAAARHALDLALQRGGDQVVVKSAASTEFYGGRTKTVQKKTKVRSRVVANELAEKMSQSSNVLIMGHKFGDHDSIGACIGMARFAASQKREANIVVNIHDANIKSVLDKLHHLEEYADIFIDEAAALDRITANTFVIAVDANTPDRFESEAIFKNAYMTAVIDHHRKNAEFINEPDVVYIEPSASSASELVTEILEQTLSPGDLLKEEAELLLAGIILDTKSFSRNTGTRTFAAALYLRGEGANPAEALSLFKTDISEYTKESRFGNNIIMYKNMIAISIYEEEAELSYKTAGAKAADRMLGIDGVAASFVVFRIGQDVHISARSLGDINVQLILEYIGGGGNFEFAGAQLRDTSLKDAVILLKNAIDEYFGET